MFTIILALVLALPGTQPDKYKEPKPEFFIKSESVVYCPVTGEYEFEIKFNVEPDFVTVEDVRGIQKHRFEFAVWYEGPFIYREIPIVIMQPPVDALDVVEVYEFDRGRLGHVVLRPPCRVSNKTVSFSVPASVIGAE